MNLVSKNTVIATLATVIFIDEVIIAKVNQKRFQKKQERIETLHSDLDRVWHLVLHYQKKMDEAGVELDDLDKIEYINALPTV